MRHELVSSVTRPAMTARAGEQSTFTCRSGSFRSGVANGQLSRCRVARGAPSPPASESACRTRSRRARRRAPRGWRRSRKAAFRSAGERSGTSRMSFGTAITAEISNSPRTGNSSRRSRCSPARCWPRSRAPAEPRARRGAPGFPAGWSLRRGWSEVGNGDAGEDQKAGAGSPRRTSKFVAEAICVGSRADRVMGMGTPWASHAMPLLRRRAEMARRPA